MSRGSDARSARSSDGGSILLAPFNDSRLGAFCVAILAFVIASSALGNGFTLDDVPIIASNDRVHALSSIGRLFSQTYWPPSEGASLYRPLTMAWFTLQWVAGKGSPFLFHLVNGLLYALACASFYLLAAEAIPVGPAFVAAGLFAVHPVHVEVFANVVGQPELWVATIMFLACRHYVRRRRAGMFTGRDSVYLVASSFQERVRTLSSFFFLLAMAGATFAFLRTGVIGRFAGAGQNGLLSVSSFDVRLWTALTMGREWVRLLSWPAVLSADYSFRRLDVSQAFEPVMLVSVLIIAVSAVIAWRARDEHGPFALGVAWAFVSLILPSNLFIVTGFMLAERALFLASAGFLICAAAGASYLWNAAAKDGPRLRLILSVVGAVLFAAGLMRSVAQAPVWKDNGILFRQTVNDALGRP